jgi:dihydroorotase
MKTLIKNAIVVNQNEKFIGGILIDNDIIERVFEGEISDIKADKTIDFQQNYLIQGN